MQTPLRPRPAAFFDLDKTILATSSALALRHPLREAGLVSRRTMALGFLIHLPYLLRGADTETMDRMADALGALARGWDPARLERTVRDSLGTSIDPVCFTEALDLIAWHRAAGHAVVVASASLVEMVRPIAELLGADAALGSHAEVDDRGRMTGHLTAYNQGEEKARACVALAGERGWDLAASWAYSDSVSDLPMLEAVGHPVAVNPDHALLEAARERHWQVSRFTRTVRVRPTRERVLPLVGIGAAGVVAGMATWGVARQLRRAAV